MKFAYVLASAVSVFGMMSASAQVQAGFDCAKASTPTEIAICGDEEAAASDRGMAIAYKALYNEADAEMKKYLAQDQQAFLKIRAEAYESHTSTPEFKLAGLIDRTEMRAEFLNWISLTDSQSLIGTWRNAWGIIRITPKGDDGMFVDLNVADAAHGTWVCNLEDEVGVFHPKRALFQSDAGDLELLVKGAVLNVPTPFCDETTSGGFGTAAGTYFRVGAEE